MIAVDRISKLARLGLNKEEKKKLTKELSAILSFVEKLSEVKTEKTEPTAQVTSLESVTRQDKERVKTKKETDKLISLAPETEGRHIKVKPVF